MMFFKTVAAVAAMVMAASPVLAAGHGGGRSGGGGKAASHSGGQRATPSHRSARAVSHKPVSHKPVNKTSQQAKHTPNHRPNTYPGHKPNQQAKHTPNHKPNTHPGNKPTQQAKHYPKHYPNHVTKTYGSKYTWSSHHYRPYRDTYGHYYNASSRCWYDGSRSYCGGLPFRYIAGFWYYGEYKWYRTSYGWKCDAPEPPTCDSCQTAYVAPAPKPVCKTCVAPAPAPEPVCDTCQAPPPAPAPAPVCDTCQAPPACDTCEGQES